jgi:hypothetical protein
MLTFLAAAAAVTVALSGQPFDRPMAPIQHYIGGHRLDVITGPSLACAKAGRMQTSFDNALLYRKDRDHARAKRLIDLPMAHACLVGASKGAAK